VNDDQDDALWDGQGVINTTDGPVTGSDEDW